MTDFDPSKLERIVRVTHRGSYSEVFDAAYDDAEDGDDSQDSAGTRIGFMQCSPDGYLYVSAGEQSLVVLDEHLFEPPRGQSVWEPRPVAGGARDAIRAEPIVHDLGSKVECMHVDDTGIVHLAVGRSELVRVHDDKIISRQDVGAKIYAVCGVDSDTTYAVVGGSQVELLHKGDRSAVVNVGEQIQDILVVGDILYVMLESGQLQMYRGSPTPLDVLNLRSKGGSGPFAEYDDWFALFRGPQRMVCIQGEHALALVQDGRCVGQYTFPEWDERDIDDALVLGDGSAVFLAESSLWRCSDGRITRGRDDLYSVLDGSPLRAVDSCIAPRRVYVQTGWKVHALDLQLDYLVPEEQMHELLGGKGREAE